MKIYKLCLYDKMRTSLGYEYFDKRSIAKSQMNDPEMEYELDVLHIPANRSGILRALNMHGGHPDNG